MRRLLTLPLLAVLTMGCSGEGTIPEDFDPGDADDPGDPLDTGDTGEDGPDVRTFALLEVVSLLMVDPSPLGNDERATVTTSWKRVDWSREGVDVTWIEDLCDLESTEVFGTQTTFPDALVDSVPPQVRHGVLSEAVTGSSLTAGPHASVFGATLTDPLGEALPTEDTDSRVFDQDGDGQPGVTVQAHNNLFGNADIYVVQRDLNAFDGVVVSGERIEGFVANTSEQVVLGASSWWADAETETRSDPEPSHSWFIFQQVAEDATCASILAERDTLFD